MKLSEIVRHEESNKAAKNNLFYGNLSFAQQKVTFKWMQIKTN